MATAAELIEEIKKMSVLELSELVKAATALPSRKSPPRSTWCSPVPATRRSR
jgi:hypothetical protein